MVLDAYASALPLNSQIDNLARPSRELTRTHAPYTHTGGDRTIRQYSYITHTRTRGLTYTKTLTHTQANDVLNENGVAVLSTTEGSTLQYTIIVIMCMYYKYNIIILYRSANVLYIIYTHSMRTTVFFFFFNRHDSQDKGGTCVYALLRSPRS